MTQTLFATTHTRKFCKGNNPHRNTACAWLSSTVLYIQDHVFIYGISICPHVNFRAIGIAWQRPTSCSAVIFGNETTGVSFRLLLYSIKEFTTWQVKSTYLYTAFSPTRECSSPRSFLLKEHQRFQRGIFNCCRAGHRTHPRNCCSYHRAFYITTPTFLCSWS